MHDKIVPRDIGERPGLPEARDRAIDDVRLQALGGVVIDLKSLRHAATIGFNDDIRLRDQSVGRGAIAFL